MKPSFDPYSEWLHVPDAKRPPNTYELLGLAPGEKNADRIQVAYEERYERVRKYQNGPYAELAQRILSELTCASESLKTVTGRREPELERSSVQEMTRVPIEVTGTTKVAHASNDIGPSPLTELRSRELLFSSSVPESSGEAHTFRQAASSENGLGPTDQGRSLPDDKDLLSRLVMGLAVANSIVALLALWLPDVAIYFISLAVVFGFWHLANEFNSPPWRELGKLFKTWAKSRMCYWRSQRTCSAESATLRRSVRILHKRIKVFAVQQASLENTKAKALDDVQKRELETQLSLFLRNHAIRDHLQDIPNIGEKRLSALASSGIATAYDVSYERVVTIDGIGSAAAASLVTWQTNVTRRFKFNAELMPKGDILAIERNFLAKRTALNDEIRKNSDKVRLLNATSRRKLESLKESRAQALEETNQAWSGVQKQMACLKRLNITVVLATVMIATLGFAIISFLQ